MIGLLVISVALIILSGWFFTQIFLRFPVYIFHSFDWLFSWFGIFEQVGHWLAIAIFVLILSWFLKE